MSDAAIREVIDRETQAWDSQDVQLLLSVFHPDMVWAWPRSYTSVDPVDWHLPLGRFDAVRWGAAYDDLFRSRNLIHNTRNTVRIEVPAQADGALAVVDIDTLWRETDTGLDDHWLGRTCKLYALVSGEWKMTAQIGHCSIEPRPPRDEAPRVAELPRGSPRPGVTPPRSPLCRSWRPACGM